MALRRVAELVNRAAVDSRVLHALKNDPASLKNLLQLSSTDVAALHSAQRVANKPLVQTSDPSQSAAATPKLGAADTLVLVTAGTLLPPYGSGNFQTAAGGFVPVGTPTAGPAPKPPAPSPQPPSPGLPPSPPQAPGTSQPPAPALPPAGPPSPPVTYQAPPPSPMPLLPPQRLLAQSARCCSAAIAAASSMVAQTSLAAIAAITAIAQIDSG